MKITPMIHQQAPELSYFFINGKRFNLSNNLHWAYFGDLTINKIIAEIRKRYFKRAEFVRYLSVQVVYSNEYSYLNTTYFRKVSSTNDIPKVLAKLNLAKKHNVNGDLTYNVYDMVGDKAIKTDEKPMPKAEIKLSLHNKYLT